MEKNIDIPISFNKGVFGRFFAYIGKVNLILTFRIDLKNQISIELYNVQGGPYVFTIFYFF